MVDISSKVEVRRGEQVGVVVQVPGEPLQEGEIAVIWYGGDIEFLDSNTVEVIGPDPAGSLSKEVAKKCGMGKAADCCIFLMSGTEGLECGRFGPFHFTVIQRRSQLNSKRIPLERFPNCQLPDPV